jgi:protein-disulfide isomerase
MGKLLIVFSMVISFAAAIPFWTHAEESQFQSESEANRGAEDNDQRAREYAAKLDTSRPILGARKARATIIEFGDFQCPYCGRSHGTIKELFALRPNQIKYAFRHLPLDFHPMARPSAQYFEAIAIQS